MEPGKLSEELLDIMTRISEASKMPVSTLQELIDKDIALAVLQAELKRLSSQVKESK